VRLCGWYTVVESCGAREWCGGRGLQESTSESLEWNPISVGVSRCLNVLLHRTAVRFIFEGFTVLGCYALFDLTYFGTTLRSIFESQSVGESSRRAKL
jgi:hypothetical protein